MAVFASHATGSGSQPQHSTVVGEKVSEPQSLSPENVTGEPVDRMSPEPRLFLSTSYSPQYRRL